LIDWVVDGVSDDKHEREYRVECSGFDHDSSQRDVVLSVFDRESPGDVATIHEQSGGDEDGQDDVDAERDNVV
jgi:hypothetical protein